MRSVTRSAVEESRNLTGLIREATAALARMDAERLSELALSCEALNRELASHTADACSAKAGLREARKAMRVFARVMQATGANVEFVRRLRAPQSEWLEYRPDTFAGWSADGHH